ncbi:hypothetical protein [Mycobacterium sp. M23085]|uniref:hypothetical protein n=1 Tax=Mycobacterium sp. M23085 TaxID=3378087 RepID=UPI003877A500
MTNRKDFTVGALMAVTVSVTLPPPAHAEPLKPLTPGEVQYLNHAHQVYAASRNPTALRSDGELLIDGRYACDKRAAGYVGVGATFVDPVLSQLAFIYLCP